MAWGTEDAPAASSVPGAAWAVCFRGASHTCLRGSSAHWGQTGPRSCWDRGKGQGLAAQRDPSTCWLGRSGKALGAAAAKWEAAGCGGVKERGPSCVGSQPQGDEGTWNLQRAHHWVGGRHWGQAARTEPRSPRTLRVGARSKCLVAALWEGGCEGGGNPAHVSVTCARSSEGPRSRDSGAGSSVGGGGGLATSPKTRAGGDSPRL